MNYVAEHLRTTRCENGHYRTADGGGQAVQAATRPGLGPTSCSVDRRCLVPQRGEWQELDGEVYLPEQAETEIAQA